MIFTYSILLFAPSITRNLSSIRLDVFFSRFDHWSIPKSQAELSRKQFTLPTSLLPNPLCLFSFVLQGFCFSRIVTHYSITSNFIATLAFLHKRHWLTELLSVVNVLASLIGQFNEAYLPIVNDRTSPIFIYLQSIFRQGCSFSKSCDQLGFPDSVLY